MSLLATATEKHIRQCHKAMRKEWRVARAGVCPKCGAVNYIMVHEDGYQCFICWKIVYKVRGQP